MESEEIVKSLPIMVSPDERLDYLDSENIVQIRGKNTYEDFIFLSTAGRELFEISLEVDIYKFVAEWVNKLLKNSFVIVCSCDEAQSALRVRAAGGIGKDFEKIFAAIGRNPIGLSMPLNDEARKGLANGSLEKVEGGITELTCGKIPGIMCNGLESILNISSTYAKGLTWLGEIMGSVAILMRYENEINHVKAIETFLDYSAVVMHRRLNGKCSEAI